MAIDILNIQPSVISRDLKGKYIAIYGKEKVGKTSFAASFPKNLILSFEIGTNALSGIRAQKIERWSDFKLVLRQLEKPEAQAMYDTITIDTVTIAWDLCETYICAQHGVQKISDIPWGAGFAACKKEFESCLRKITMLGYGIVIISHDAKRIEKTPDGSEIEILFPDVPKRARDIVNQLVDIIGYIGIEWDSEGKSQRYLYTRQTPTIMAGSRYKYLDPKIKFGYNELVNAVADAIEKSEKLDGAIVVDEVEQTVVEKLNYEEIRKKAFNLWVELVGEGEDADAEMAQRILKKVEMIFGRQIKLSEITEDQVDLFNLVVLEMEDIKK